VRFSGSFALYLFSDPAGRHDDEDLISLTRLPVNNPPPAMQSERVGLREKGVVSKRVVFLRLQRDQRLNLWYIGKRNQGFLRPRPNSPQTLARLLTGTEIRQVNSSSMR
jgi:hypothetical protein